MTGKKAHPSSSPSFVKFWYFNLVGWFIAVTRSRPRDLPCLLWLLAHDLILGLPNSKAGVRGDDSNVPTVFMMYPQRRPINMKDGGLVGFKRRKGSGPSKVFCKPLPL